MAYPPPQQSYPPPVYPSLPPEVSITQQVGRMSLQSGPPTPSAGDSPLLSVFTHGNTIFLKSVASGNNLRINNGEVEGTGGQGKLAQFIVHVRRPGVVALQNVNADSYLAIYDGRTIGTGRGGPYCEFLVGEIEGKSVTLESSKYPGQFTGVSSDGKLKPPSQCGSGGEARRFVPLVYSNGTVPGSNQPPPRPPPPQFSCSQGPPPQGPPPQYSSPQGPPPQGPPPQFSPQGPPPQGPPPQQYLPQQSYPGQPQPVTTGYHQYQVPPPGQQVCTYTQYPPQQVYPGYTQSGYAPATVPQPVQYPPHTMPYVSQPYGYGAPVSVAVSYTQPLPQPQLVGPQIPIGFNVLDALQGGNTVQLICKTTNKPVSCMKGATNANGPFGKENSTFIVVVPGTPPPAGPIMLHNTVSTGIYLSVNKGGYFHVGRGRKWSHLKPVVQGDGSVSLQSIEFRGLVCFNQKGLPSKAANLQDPGSQFFIRIEKQTNNTRQTIMTPFGRPSLANQLRTDCLIQLYLKPFNQYLSINKLGTILTIANGNDTDTCFRLTDRGMGRYSFESHKYKTFRLVLANNILSGKGIADKSSDFQLKENADGTVCFESVTCPGSYIGIQGGGIAQTNLNIAIVMITGVGRSLTLTKTYLN